jgi:hypothetical protein
MPQLQLHRPLAGGPRISIVRPSCGEVAEWLKAHAWKVCRRATVSGVRIPLSPPDTFAFILKLSGTLAAGARLRVSPGAKKKDVVVP